MINIPMDKPYCFSRLFKAAARIVSTVPARERAWVDPWEILVCQPCFYRTGEGSRPRPSPGTEPRPTPLLGPAYHGRRGVEPPPLTNKGAIRSVWEEVGEGWR